MRQHITHAFQQRLHRHRLGLQPVAPGESQQPAGDGAAPLGRFADQLRQAEDRDVGAAFADQPRTAQHRLQDIVDVVRDAARQPSQRLHPLPLGQRFQRRLTLCPGRVQRRSRPHALGKQYAQQQGRGR